MFGSLKLRSVRVYLGEEITTTITLWARTWLILLQAHQYLAEAAEAGL